MIFSKLFKNKPNNWEENRKFILSPVDLKLLPEQVIYVEGKYERKINEYISKEYNAISQRLKETEIEGDLIYLPVIAKQFQNAQQNQLSYFFHYFFPNVNREEESNISLQTKIIAKSILSSIGYETKILPGFLRYVGKDKFGFFVYEYFRIKASRKFYLPEQIAYYIITCENSPEFTFPTTDEDESEFVAKVCEEEIKPYFLLNKLIDLELDDEKDSVFDNKSQREIIDECSMPKESSQARQSSAKRAKFIIPKEEESTIECCAYAVAEVKESAIPSEKQQEIIAKIKDDIQNLKDLGFYELLIKEIGSALYGKENTAFKPSRLIMDDNFKIFLPDFNNMEIEMTPLPKSLFILFLRHPEGIYLKSLIDYKKELLEIYKLLSYRETYFEMVESIERICNPLEGSINEKLSRVKEAFLKKISKDNAKYYIITGERGMKKKIEIDRSLIKLPAAFEEIGLTVV